MGLWFFAKSTPPQPSPLLRKREGAEAPSLCRRQGEGWGGVALDVQCKAKHGLITGDTWFDQWITVEHFISKATKKPAEAGIEEGLNCL